MSSKRVDTLIVGGGQAGIAVSEHLQKAGISHVVLEKDRIAEQWRTGRWDSLVANGPAWHDRFPNLEFDAADPHSFVAKDNIAAYFTAYVEKFDLPVHSGVTVTRCHKPQGAQYFSVETTDGPFEAKNIVAATGAFQIPVSPPLIPASEPVTQLHSAQYRNPAQLADGAVLIVGAGSSGVQIAEELMQAGKTVYLSVGPHDRPPRFYRGRDFCWWLGVLGKWDAPAMEPGKEHVTIAVSGADGGKTIDFRTLAAQGMTLLGRTNGYKDGVVSFGDDLVDNIRNGDETYLSLLDEADAYIEKHGIDLPEEPDARRFLADPDCMTNPISELDLNQAGITSVIWATGFRNAYDWLEADVFDADGKPIHQRGVSPEPGVYFLGLPWQSRRGSSFIWGVWHDARHIADQIAIRQRYAEHHRDVSPVEPPLSSGVTSVPRTDTEIA